MRRVLALICLALLAACGSQNGDISADDAAAADQAETQVADGTEAAVSEDLAQGESGEGEDIEEESGAEFGDPLSDGEPDLAAASAPMDDAQGIDPHAEMDSGESSEDY